jgi:hypothetical protein
VTLRTSPHASAPAFEGLELRPRRLSGRVWLGLHCGLHYLRGGIGILAFAPWLYVTLLVLLTVPSLGAASLAAAGMAQGLGPGTLRFALDAVSASVAPVVMMVAVAAGARRVDPGVAGALRRAPRWLPRYLWTNLHTSVIFWIPMAALLALSQWQDALHPLSGAARVLATAGWAAAVLTLGGYLHTRTLLAPFHAVHGDMPGTIATLESWRVSGRYFWPVFGTLFVTALPPALLPLALYAGLLVAVQGSPVLTGALFDMTPSLVWVGIMFVRPFLITATYLLREHLWQIELRRRAIEGHPPQPRALRPLLTVSRALPRAAGALARRPIRYSL